MTQPTFQIHTNESYANCQPCSSCVLWIHPPQSDGPKSFICFSEQLRRNNRTSDRRRSERGLLPAGTVENHWCCTSALQVELQPWIWEEKISLKDSFTFCSSAVHQIRHRHFDRVVTTSVIQGIIIKNQLKGQRVAILWCCCRMHPVILSCKEHIMLSSCWQINSLSAPLIC